MDKLSNIKLRLLNEDEFYREDLVSIFKSNGSIVPDSRAARILIAETNEGKLIGLYTMQPQLHAEPMWIDEEYKDTLLCIKLGRELLNLYNGIKGLVIYTFSPNNKTGSLLKRLGFNKLNYEVYSKEME